MKDGEFETEDAQVSDELYFLLPFYFFFPKESVIFFLKRMFMWLCKCPENLRIADQQAVTESFIPSSDQNPSLKSVFWLITCHRTGGQPSSGDHEADLLTGGEANEKIQLGLKTGQRQMVVIVWHLSLCNCSHREEANFLHKFELKSFKNTKRNRSLI